MPLSQRKFHSGVRLQKIRMLNGYGINELAQDLAVHESDIHDWEQVGIPETELSKLCLYFEVPAEIFTLPVESEKALGQLISRSLFPRIEGESEEGQLQMFEAVESRLNTPQKTCKVRIERLVLENIGVYDYLEIEFRSNVSVLIGLNGAGKTTILKSLSLAVLGPDLVNDIQGLSNNLLKIIGLNNKKTQWVPQGSITLFVSIDDQPPISNRIDLFYNSISERVEVKGDCFHALFKREGLLKNLILGISEQRVARPKRPALLAERDKQAKVADLLPLLDGEDLSCIDYFSSWLGNLCNEQKNGNSEAEAIIDSVFEIFSALMQESISFVDMSSVSPLELWVRYDKNNKIIPLSLVSQGYQAVMGWVGLIVKRMYDAYEEVQDIRPFNQGAIILLDEIDQLLHVKWQQKIINILADKYFPNVQWIITTHSPLVVSGLDKDQVIHIQEQDNKFIAEYNSVDLWLWRYGDVVRHLFEIGTEKPKYTTQDIKEKIKLLSNPPSTLSDNEKKELKCLYSQLEKLEASEAFVNELKQEQLKLRKREQELANLIMQLKSQK